MAAGTTGSDASMVHAGATFEAGGVFVAGFTRRTGGDVGARFGFYIAEAAAVTGRAAGGDASMAHDRWGEAAGIAVTALTFYAGGNMRSG